MTSPKRKTALLVGRPGRFGLVLILLALMVAVGSAPVSAQSASPETRTPKSGTPFKKARRAGAVQTSKPAGTKAKSRVRGMAKTATPAPESTAPPSPESEEKSPATPQVRTSETVDFDNDADDAQKLEPGLDLIQAAPSPARHRSLVPASPSPEDSVVNRQ